MWKVCLLQSSKQLVRMHIYTPTPKHNTVGLHGGQRWSQAKREGKRKRKEGVGLWNPHGRSGAGGSCFYTKPPSTTPLLPPSPIAPPWLTQGFSLLCNKLKQWAVSCFNSPIPSSHYSPNYRHPPHQFLYSSQHVTKHHTTVQYWSSLTAQPRWREMLEYLHYIGS